MQVGLDCAVKLCDANASFREVDSQNETKDQTA